MVTVVLDVDWGLVVVRVVAVVEEVVSGLVVVTGLGLVLVVVWGEVELIVAPVVLVVDSVRVITRVKAHIFHSKPYLYPPGLSGSLHIERLLACQHMSTAYDVRCQADIMAAARATTSHCEARGGRGEGVDNLSPGVNIGTHLWW